MFAIIARATTRSRLLPALLVAWLLVLSACGSTTETVDQAAGGAAGDRAGGGADDGEETGVGGTERDADGDGGSNADADVGAEVGDPPDDGAAGSQATPAGAADVDSIGALMLASVDTPQSYRFEGVVELTGEPSSEMPGSFSLTFGGAEDPANRASEVTMDFSGMVDAMAQAEGGDAAELAMFAGMLTDPLRVITIGDTSYVQWSLLTMFTGGDGDMWLETTNDGVDDLTSGFGMETFGSPDEVLGPLEDADATIVVVGTETVRGVDTTHYAAEVELRAWYESLPAGEQEAFDREFEDSGLGGLEAAVPVDLWITDDGRVAKLVYDISDPTMMEGEGLASATISIEVYDVGADLGIAPPPADKVISEDEMTMDFGA